MPAVPALLYRVEEAAEALRLSRHWHLRVDSVGSAADREGGPSSVGAGRGAGGVRRHVGAGGVTERRARGDGGLRWHERRQRWIASVTVGYDGRGKRIVRSASGRTRTEAKAKLREHAAGPGGRASRRPRTVHGAPGGRGLAGVRATRRGATTCRRTGIDLREAHLPTAGCAEAARSDRAGGRSVAGSAVADAEHPDAAGVAERA